MYGVIVFFQASNMVRRIVPVEPERKASRLLHGEVNLAMECEEAEVTLPHNSSNH